MVSGVGARNERYLCAVYYGKTSGFEVVHGLLDKMMHLLDIVKDASDGYSIVATNRTFNSCRLLPSKVEPPVKFRLFSVLSDRSFFPERCAEIHYKKKKIGLMGILHPEVLLEFDLSLPCSCIEFSIEPFL